MIERFVADVDKEKAIAVLGNELVEAYYSDFTLYELRILHFVISLISPDDEEFKLYRISVKVLEELVGAEVYKTIERTIRDLVRKEIVLRSGNKFVVVNVFSLARYEKGSGYFEVMLNEILKPFLLKLKERFTKLPLLYSFNLNSKYSLRIYELLKQYEDTGYRKDGIMELRKMLGIEDNEYTRFTNFEERVLRVAEKEINEKTDLKVSYKKQKIGRKITHITWVIQKKSERELENIMLNANIKVDKQEKIITHIREKHIVLIYPEEYKDRISDMENFHKTFKFRVNISKDFIYVLCVDEKEANEFISKFGEPIKREKLKVDAMAYYFFNFQMLITSYKKFINDFYNYMKKRGLFEED